MHNTKFSEVIIHTWAIIGLQATLCRLCRDSEELPGKDHYKVNVHLLLRIIVTNVFTQAVHLECQGPQQRYSLTSIQVPVSPVRCV